jgi:hypothetical protein
MKEKTFREWKREWNAKDRCNCAASWLVDELKDSLPHQVLVLKQAARNFGYGVYFTSLKQAREMVGAKAEKINGIWYWSLELTAPSRTASFGTYTPTMTAKQVVGYTRQLMGYDKEPTVVERMMENVKKFGYRELAKKFHPDTGGSQEQMITLNAAVAEMRRMGQSVSR